MMRPFLLLIQTGFYAGPPAWVLSLFYLPLAAQAVLLAWGLMSHGLWMVATFFPAACGFVPVARGFRTEQSEVWLTFDDGPDPELTPRVLDVLRQFQARATFFVIGRKARAHPELIARIAAEGHSLANHTNTHPSATFWFFPAAWIRRQIDRCADVLGEQAGSAGYFRPPAGLVPPTLAAGLAASRASRVVLWSARAFDTQRASPRQIVERLAPRLRPGAIILLHPERNGHALAALGLLLGELERRGLVPVIPPPASLVVR